MIYHRSTLIALQGLNHFDEILAEADGIILSRGNLGIDLPPEKVVYLIKLFCSAPHLFQICQFLGSLVLRLIHQPIHEKQTFEAWWPYTHLVTSVLSPCLGYFSTLMFGLLQYSPHVWATSVFSSCLGSYMDFKSVTIIFLEIALVRS